MEFGVQVLKLGLSLWLLCVWTRGEPSARGTVTPPSALGGEAETSPRGTQMGPFP